MTKKIIIIALAFVLCLSVIGGCFALYAKDAEELKITFGSEDAVRLSLAPTGSLTFGNVLLNPDNRSATQDITLDVSAKDKSVLAGMYGKFSVTVTGTLANSVELTAKSGTTTYQQSTLSTGINLPLNALPKSITLTLKLKDTVDDNGFMSISNTAATITVSWRPVEWAPVDNAYYIVGSFSGWEVNSKAIKMNAPAEGNTSLAEWTGTLPEGTAFKCVQYKVVGESYKYTWFDVAYQSENGPAKVDVYGDGEGGVTELNGNLVAPNEAIYVCVNTEDGSHFSWGQTTASMTSGD